MKAQKKKNEVISIKNNAENDVKLISKLIVILNFLCQKGNILLKGLSGWLFAYVIFFTNVFFYFSKPLEISIALSIFSILFYVVVRLIGGKTKDIQT